MREIKFRAWFGAENRWLCGYNADREGCHILGETIGLAGGFVGEVGIGEELNTVIVEQFTGLRDKNGKDIYEGDIVHGTTRDFVKDVTGTVVYTGMAFAFVNDDDWFFGVTSPHITKLDEIEVIGNIHENPELLKK